MLLLAALCLLAAPWQQSGTVVDGLVAVVDGHAITRSEAEDHVNFARLAAQLAPQAAPNPAAPQALAPITPAELSDAVRHLVEERLLLEARADEGYAWAPDAEVERQWQHWQSLVGGAAKLDRLLTAYRLDAPTARAILRDQVTILDMLDLRLGGTFTISDADVADYYHHSAGGSGAVPAALHDPIAAILRQQKLSDAGQQWIGELRQAAHVELRLQPL